MNCAKCHELTAGPPGNFIGLPSMPTNLARVFAVAICFFAIRFRKHFSIVPMRFNFILIFLLAGVVARSQTPMWTQFPNSPVGGGNFRNDDISFTDLTNGWSARGTDGIYHTTNCGQSWFSITPHIVTNVAHFRSIGFASPTRGWAGNLGPGSYDGNVTDTNMLYETFDGGNTWNIVQVINNSGMKGFCAMHIPDAQHIYGVGRVRGPAYFVKSEDGGSTWFTTNLTAAGVMGGLMDVYFMNTNLGFTVGMDTNSFFSPPYFGSIARTTNGGLNWHVVASVKVTNSYFWKMSWPSTTLATSRSSRTIPIPHSCSIKPLTAVRLGFPMVFRFQRSVRLHRLNCRASALSASTKAGWAAAP